MIANLVDNMLGEALTQEVIYITIDTENMPDRLDDIYLGNFTKTEFDKYKRVFGIAGEQVKDKYRWVTNVVTGRRMLYKETGYQDYTRTIIKLPFGVLDTPFQHDMQRDITRHNIVGLGERIEAGFKKPMAMTISGFLWYDQIIQKELMTLLSKYTGNVDVMSLLGSLTSFISNTAFGFGKYSAMSHSPPVARGMISPITIQDEVRDMNGFRDENLRLGLQAALGGGFAEMIDIVSFINEHIIRNPMIVKIVANFIKFYEFCFSWMVESELPVRIVCKYHGLDGNFLLERFNRTRSVVSGQKNDLGYKLDFVEYKEYGAKTAIFTPIDTDILKDQIVSREMGVQEEMEDMGEVGEMQ